MVIRLDDAKSVLKISVRQRRFFFYHFRRYESWKPSFFGTQFRPYGCGSHQESKNLQQRCSLSFLDPFQFETRIYSHTRSAGLLENLIPRDGLKVFSYGYIYT